jgi:hypothetical protein
VSISAIVWSYGGACWLDFLLLARSATCHSARAISNFENDEIGLGDRQKRAPSRRDLADNRATTFGTGMREADVVKSTFGDDRCAPSADGPEKCTNLLR